MTRYADVITLRSITHAVNDEGAVVETYEDTDVFANRYYIGLSDRIAGASEGLKGLCEFQVRSIDYAGQGYAVWNDTEYTVNSVSDRGDFTLLTMSVRLRNA